MQQTWTEETIERCVSDQVEEGQQLEYKRAAALSPDKKNEIAKDVSAMANANGGIIIYGVEEVDSFGHKIPKSVDPIDPGAFSTERLNQIINSNIEPRIEGIEIIAVPLAKHERRFVYVVIVPEGVTAHQASDLRYYRRYGSECLQMHDREIRDVMNRSRYARLEVKFAVQRVGGSTEDGSDCRAWPIIINHGPVLVQHLKLFIRLPRRLLRKLDPIDRKARETVFEVLRVEPGYARLENAYCDITVRNDNILFPDDEVSFEKVGLIYYCDRWFRESQKPTARWQLWADNMPRVADESSLIPE